MRAPGVTQGIFVMESILDQLADTIGMDVNTLRAANFYTVGEATPSGDVIKYLSLPSVWQQLLDQCNFTTTQKAVDAFNAANRWRKRGIAIIPVKCVVVSRLPARG